ncbi:MAG: type I restriction endonuclease subunit R [bacterium]|nr:type I restriction endonuclease subunit R [bacterium]
MRLLAYLSGIRGRVEGVCVVHSIGLNSSQLKEKLEKGKDIIITTLQKFPMISESVSQLKGNTFAVIIDEAHSSQSGESAKHLKKTLNTDLQHAEAEDTDHFDPTDEIIKEIRTRGIQPNISYFAFTATPKGKTLELFSRPDPNGQYRAFHLYSMRQAIEENFILDVLRNYTTFERYFKLVKSIPRDDEYTETGLNRLKPRAGIVDSFKTPQYRILIAAEKFQTGFDEPLLHTMYVDKKLGGLHAVQTLSRLNRVTAGKTETLVLDFVNHPEDIQKAFQYYYQTAILEEIADPNKLYELQNQLEEYEIFFPEDVEDFAEIFFNKKHANEKLQPVLDTVVERFRTRERNDREDFRAILQKYTRFYGYVSQLITFEDIDLEKLYVFARSLGLKLPQPEYPLPIEVREAVDLDSFRIQQTFKGRIELVKTDGMVTGPTDGTPHTSTDDKDLLSNIVKFLNDTYGINLTEEDRLDIERMDKRLLDDENLRAVMLANNTRANKNLKFNRAVDILFQDFVHTKLDLYKKLTDPKYNTQLKAKWFERYVEHVEASSRPPQPLRRPL